MRLTKVDRARGGGEGEKPSRESATSSQDSLWRFREELSRSRGFARPK